MIHRNARHSRPTLKAYARSLDIAVMQFKLALQVCSAAHCGGLPQRLAGMSYGGLHIDKQGLRLSFDDAALAGTALRCASTFSLAVAVDSALAALFGTERFTSR